MMNFEKALTSQYPTSIHRREYFIPDAKKTIFNIIKILPSIQYVKDNPHILNPSIKQLKKLNKQLLKNNFGYYIDVEYIRDAFGRYYSKGNVSYQNLWREARNTLIDCDKYRDFDIHNACPQILQQVCNELEINNHYLTYYCENRNDCLIEVMQKMNISKYNAKNLFIRLLFGGKFENFIRDMFNKENDFNTDFDIQWLKPLFDELDVIKNKLFNLNLPVIENIKKYINRKKKNNSHQGFYTNNKMGSFLSCILFTIENYINHIATDYIMKYENFSVDATIHDGFHIRLYDNKPDGFSFNKDDENQLCYRVNQYVLEKTGFNLTFTIKDFDNNYHNEIRNMIDNDRPTDFGDDDEVILFGVKHNRNYLELGVHNEDDACKKILKLYPFWKCCNDVLYCLDWDLGYWSSSKNTHIKILNKLALYIGQYYYDDKIEDYKVNYNDSYGSKVSKINQVLQLLPSKCIDDNWLEKSQNSSYRCLLFTNGYIDYRNNDKIIFENKFNQDGEKNPNFKWNKDIVFFDIIGYDFNFNLINHTDKINYIKQNLIYNPLGQEQGNYILQYMACSLFGEVKLKKLLFALGDSNTGKNTITMALNNVCANLFGNFNAENLCKKKFESNDEAQALRWFYLLKNKRIVVSNELDSSRILNGNMIKKIASGGDKITGRGHRENETDFIANCNSLIFANDIPKIKPLDTAVRNRIRFITFKKCFVDKPIDECNEFELPKNDDFCNYVRSTEFASYFICILLDEYTKYRDNGWFEPDCVINNFDDWVDDDDNIINKFLNEVEITKDENDFIKNEDIKNIIKGYDISIKKWTMEFKKYLTLKKLDDVVCDKRTTIKGKCVRGWVGLKIIEDENNNDDF